MAIKLATDCMKCTHNKVCMHKNCAEANMRRLKGMKYGDGPNDDYDWDTMMEHYHVTITFSCPDYEEVKPVWR